MSTHFFVILLLLGIFGTSKATKFVLDSESDLELPYWTTTCNYANTVQELDGDNCFKNFIPSDVDGRIGVWTDCNQFQSCQLTFNYPEDFLPTNISLTAFIYDSGVHVDTSVGTLGSFEMGNEWQNLNLDVSQDLLGPERQIKFIVEGLGDGVFDLITIEGDNPKITCDPKNCTHTGSCTSFERCSRDGFLEKIPCPKDQDGHSLWWNSERNSEHGGTCDLWRDLSSELQSRYLEDPACAPPCEFIPDGPCSPNYSYIKMGKSSELTCGPELLFNPKIETCDYCYNIEVEGGNCCMTSEIVRGENSTETIDLTSVTTPTSPTTTTTAVPIPEIGNGNN